MKKIKFLGMVAVAAMAVSCSSDDVVTQVQEDNAIQFGTYVGNAAQSRGTIATLDNVEDGFGVFAYYTGTTAFASYTGTTPNFMNNEKVYYEDGAWKYDITKYWPNNNAEKVSFFAYAPYDQTYKVSSNGKVTYSVPANVTEQRDLLWSRSNTTDLTKQTVNGLVTFNFAHALARVGVTVSCAIDAANTPATGTIADGTTIVVDKIVFSSKNDVTTAGPAPEPTDANGAFYTQGVIDMNATSENAYGNDVWESETGAQIITLTADNFKGDLTFDISDNAKDANADNSYMMIIPQDFSTDGLYVWVDYTVTTTDAKLDGSSVIQNKISQKVPVNFQQGKAYTLNLVLGMTSVKVEAAIDEWSLVDDAQVDVPANK